MENQTQAPPPNDILIKSFCEITSSSPEDAQFFLESHQWDLDSAVSAFFDNLTAQPINPPPSSNPPISPYISPSPSPSDSPNYTPSQSSPSHSRSPSPVPSSTGYRLRPRRSVEKKQDRASGSRTRSGVRTLADLNRTPPNASDSDSDEPQEYYTGGEKSGMLVQDPTKAKDVDAIFSQASRSATEVPVEQSSSFRSFTGAARLLSGETVLSASSQSATPRSEVVIHNITFWLNGFTVNNGPLRRLDDPANASFMESITKSECPKELEPADRRVEVHVDLVRREENYAVPEQPRRSIAFQGVGRTLGSDVPAPAASESTVASSSITSAPVPSLGLVVDVSLPTTSIQLRLADGTRMVSRFNYNHTVRDIRAFIDASRPGGARNYQLLTMGFPPKQLIDLDQTIDEAGVANSVVIQKF